MKEMILKGMAVLAGLVMSVSLSGCGGDDDNDAPEAPVSKYAKVEVSYSVELADTFCDLWDMAVTYTTATGETKTEPIGTKWEKSYDVSGNGNIPLEYTFNVIGTPKNPLPTVDEGRVYSIAHNCWIKVIGYYADGTQSVLLLSGRPSTLSTGGALLKDAVSKERKITEGVYSISLD